MNLTLLDHLVMRQKFQTKTYPANQIICDENCLQNKIFLINKGVVKLYHLTTNGDELIPIILRDRMIFGADSIFGQKNATFSSESLTPTEVTIFEMTDVQESIRTNPKFHIDLLQILNQKYSEAENRIRVLKIRSAERRFIEAILEFNQKFGYECRTSGNIIIKLPFDQENIGKYIRVSRETVSLIISNLRYNSVLDYHHNTIIISKESLLKIQPNTSLLPKKSTKKSLIVAS